MKKQPLVSVIIPIYNTEKYLRECIESVLNQSLENIEIVCINDGSTDNSLSILTEYSKVDSRIVLHTQENSGTYLARAKGVSLSTGEYIFFLDSDDYLYKDACRIAYAEISKHCSDVVQFPVKTEDCTGCTDLRWYNRVLIPDDAEMSVDEAFSCYFIHRKYSTLLTGKIFASELCKTVFIELPSMRCHIGEDIFTFFWFCYFSKEIRCVKTVPLFCYYYGRGVSNINIVSLKKFEQYCLMSKLVDKTLTLLSEKGYTPIQKTAAKEMTRRMVEDCCRIYKNRLKPEDKKAGAKLLIKYWKHIPDAPEFLEDNLKTRLLFFRLKNSPLGSILKILLTKYRKIKKSLPVKK